MAMGFLFGVAFERANTPSLVKSTLNAVNMHWQLIDAYGMAVRDKSFLDKLNAVSTNEELEALKAKIKRAGACHAAEARQQIKDAKGKTLLNREALDELVAQANKLEEQLGGCP